MSEKLAKLVGKISEDVEEYVEKVEQISKQDAERAKISLKNKLGKPIWLRGIGIGGKPGNYCIKVNIASTTKEACHIPGIINGVPVIVEIVGNIIAQDD